MTRDKTYGRHESLLAKHILASSDGIQTILLVERVRVPMYTTSTSRYQ